VKSLPDILADALILLGDREHVVIARGDHEPLDGRNSAYQIRLRREHNWGLTTYCCETRGWLGESWSNWCDRRGWLGGAAFDIVDVLATDWRIIA